MRLSVRLNGLARLSLMRSPFRRMTRTISQVRTARGVIGGCLDSDFLEQSPVLVVRWEYEDCNPRSTAPPMVAAGSSPTTDFGGGSLFYPFLARRLERRALRFHESDYHRRRPHLCQQIGL